MITEGDLLLSAFLGGLRCYLTPDDWGSAAAAGKAGIYFPWSADHSSLSLMTTRPLVPWPTTPSCACEPADLSL